MLRALVAGERDPVVMADLAKSKLRRTIPDLIEALDGHFDDHHALIVGQLLTRLQHTEQALADLDAQIGERMRPWQHQIDLLVTIPGVGPAVARPFIAETGGDPSRFPSAAHLAVWTGVAPAMHESAGKRTPAGSRDGHPWRSRTPSWSRPTTCSPATSPTGTSATTGSPTPAAPNSEPVAWWVSSKTSATTSSSTPPADLPSPQERSGLRPDAVARPLTSIRRSVQQHRTIGLIREHGESHRQAPELCGVNGQRLAKVGQFCCCTAGRCQT
jgi:hypothetical protein